jgi:hypothetical protein
MCAPPARVEREGGITHHRRGEKGRVLTCWSIYSVSDTASKSASDTDRSDTDRAETVAAKSKEVSETKSRVSRNKSRFLPTQCMLSGASWATLRLSPPSLLSILTCSRAIRSCHEVRFTLHITHGTWYVSPYAACGVSGAPKASGCVCYGHPEGSVRRICAVHTTSVRPAKASARGRYKCRGLRAGADGGD